MGSPRPRRRDRRRGGPLRHRRRRAPAGPVPGPDLDGPRGPRGDRRHLGPVPLPRGPVRLRHVHPRLRVPPLDDDHRDRRRRHDPRATSPTPRASAGSTAPCGSGTAWSRPSGPARRRAGRSRPRRGDDRRDRRAHLPVPVLLLRLLPIRAGVRAGAARSGAVRGRARAPATLAGRPAVGRAAGRRRRQRRHRGHAGARAGRRRCARDDAAALPELRALACRRATRSRASCSAAGCRCASPPRWCGRATSRSSPPCTGSAAAARPGCAGTARRRPGPATPGLRRRHALLARLRTVGPAAVRRAGRGPVPGRARGPRVGGHGPDRDVDRARRGARLGHRAARGRRRDRDRALAADARGRDADPWTAGRSTSAGAWSTRACCCRTCRTSR